MLPDRKSARLAGNDYAVGTYFITICSYNRQNTFGNIFNGSATYSSLGCLVTDHWRKIVSHYCNVSLGAFVTMPNHFHGIVGFHKPSQVDLPPSRGLNRLVGLFKSGVTRQAKELGLVAIDASIFQPRFYDHAIRHELALDQITNYIANNPMQWQLDRENPQRTGLNDFYGWLESYTRAIAKQQPPLV
jgi:putative transposase